MRIDRHPFADQTSYWNYQLFLADARGPIGQGYVQHLTEWRPPHRCIGIVVADKFPAERLTEVATRAVRKIGSRVTWVIRDRPAWAREALTEILDGYGLEPLIAKPLAYWRSDRTSWRDAEMLSLCERVIVFHDGHSGVTKKFILKSEEFPSLYPVKVIHASGRPDRARAEPVA